MNPFSWAFPLLFPNFAGKLHQPRELRGPLPSGDLFRPISEETHQTGEPWHPSCPGGKTPANMLSLNPPGAPAARSPGLRALPLPGLAEAEDRPVIRVKGVLDQGIDLLRLGPLGHVAAQAQALFHPHQMIVQLAVV